MYPKHTKQTFGADTTAAAECGCSLATAGGFFATLAAQFNGSDGFVSTGGADGCATGADVVVAAAAAFIGVAGFASSAF
jgi:hypothetical protein